MAYYDHFHILENRSITRVGRVLADLENRHFLRLLMTYCSNKNLTILEIGCGHGFFAEQCRKQGLEYVAVEANPTLAASLRDRGFEVQEGFVPPIPLDRQFDVIFMNQVFEHMKNRDQAIEMIESCKVHLRSNGIIVICSPDIFTVREDFFQDYTHNLPTCMPMLTQIFTDCELKVLHRDYVSFFVRGLLPTRILAFMVRLFYGLGVFHVLFAKRAYQAKLSLLPSCLIIGQWKCE